MCGLQKYYIFFFFFFSFLFFYNCICGYGSSQARSQISTADASLGHSHSNIGSKPLLPPTLQLVATPDPQSTEPGQESNPHLQGDYIGLNTQSHNGNTEILHFKYVYIYYLREDLAILTLCFFMKS